MRKIIILAAFFLVNCTSTAEIQGNVSSRWTGQPLDKFVVQHGVPQVSQKLNDGRSVVEWADVHGVADRGAPVMTLVMTGTPVHDGSYQLTCKLRFVVGRSGTIEQASVILDTIGVWNTSRCAEVLR